MESLGLKNSSLHPLVPARKNRYGSLKAFAANHLMVSVQSHAFFQRF